MTQEQSSDRIRGQVREAYARAAQESGSTLDARKQESGCCGGGETDWSDRARQLGYSDEELAQAPEGANLGLGCGNPAAIAAMRPGEVVLDLGSGAGFDCFLAARQVGPTGRVIGVDMTPEMVAKARNNAAQTGLENVSFRLGEIEYLPVADNSVDVVISNCVINLSPDKPQVFRDAFRVLKPGGRVAVSDVVATAPIPDEIREDAALYSACAGGAASIEELTAMLADAGFVDIRIQPKDESRAFISEWAPGSRVEDVIASAAIEAVKPR